MAARMKAFNVDISAMHITRLVEDVGREMATEEAIGDDVPRPANPAPLMVISADGMRYRTTEADRRRAGPEASDQTAATPLTATSQSADSAAQDAEKPLPDASADSIDDDAQPAREPEDRGWRELRVALTARALPGRELPNGKYEPPQELVKTYVAETESMGRLGTRLADEAFRRGIGCAHDVVIVSDNGHGLPRMFDREFPGTPRVTDFYHVAERLGSCAKALAPNDPQSLFGTWRGLLWDGRIDDLLADLSAQAEPLAPRPKQLRDLPTPSAAHTLWQTVFYLEKYRHTMDYPTYRARGWPMGSGTVESACGQFGDRVKHGRMRWTRPHAQALCDIKAAILSQDNRWETRWPAPIPILELQPAQRAA